jgi:hypothetical protein
VGIALGSTARPVDETLLARFRNVSSEWRVASPGFLVGARLDERLPRQYVDFVRAVGPGEGFVGRQFIRLYPLDQVAAANRAYAVQKYLPEHLLFGSDGCGNALLFDCSGSTRPVLVQPFVPLDVDFAIARHESWSAFLSAMLKVAPRFRRLKANPRTLGLEVHERQPIVLGGDPNDPANKVLLRPPEHAKASVTFNKLVKKVRGSPLAP